MRDRLLLVGEDFGAAPDHYCSETYVLTGASGRRLANLADLDMLRYALACERVNVVVRPDDWRDKPLVAANVLMIDARMVGRRTILLGARVAHAFGYDHVPLLEWRRAESVTTSKDGEVYHHDRHVARMPHPSGRSRWWNDRDNVESARRFFLAATQGADGEDDGY